MQMDVFFYALAESNALLANAQAAKNDALLANAPAASAPGLGGGGGGWGVGAPETRVGGCACLTTWVKTERGRTESWRT